MGLERELRRSRVLPAPVPAPDRDEATTVISPAIGNRAFSDLVSASRARLELAPAAVARQPAPAPPSKSTGSDIQIGPGGLPYPTMKGTPTIWVMREGAVSPEWLRAQGYRRADGLRWVHPVGGDVVILMPPKAPRAPEARSAEPAVQESTEEPAPGVEEEPVATRARDEANTLSAHRAHLLADLARLKTKVGTPEYASQYAQLAASWNSLDNRLRSAIGEIPDWEAGLIDEDNQAQLDAQVFRLRELMRWQEDFSRTFWQQYGSLPSP